MPLGCSVLFQMDERVGNDGCDEIASGSSSSAGAFVHALHRNLVGVLGDRWRIWIKRIAEPIADPRFGENVLRLGWINFDFFA